MYFDRIARGVSCGLSKSFGAGWKGKHVRDQLNDTGAAEIWMFVLEATFSDDGEWQLLMDQSQLRKLEI